MTRRDPIEGRSYWVVGASSGIGAQLARELARRGASVAISARNDDALHEVAGEVLGTKTVVNEFVAYFDLLDLKSNSVASGNSISERTEVILVYALCGFSNFGAIGIQIGGIGALAPARRADLARLGPRAMFGGALGCCMTACVAGLLYGII